MEEPNTPKIVIEFPVTKYDARMLLGIWLFIFSGAFLSIFTFSPALMVRPIIGLFLLAPSIATVFVWYYLQSTYKEFYSKLWRLAIKGELE